MENQNQAQNQTRYGPLLGVTLLHSQARQPLQATLASAGLELYSLFDYDVAPISSLVVRTGIAVAIPYGYFGRIMPRNRWSTWGLHIASSIVDADFRGELQIQIQNLGSTTLEINQGDAIAEFILDRVEIPTVVLTHYLPPCRAATGCCPGCPEARARVADFYPELTTPERQELHQLTTSQEGDGSPHTSRSGTPNS